MGFDFEGSVFDQALGSVMFSVMPSLQSWVIFLWIFLQPRFSMDAAWSETGDRYMLKLFRDYVFHAVDENGLPWMDMSHMVTCLNKVSSHWPFSSSLLSFSPSLLLTVPVHFPLFLSTCCYYY